VRSEGLVKKSLPVRYEKWERGKEKKRFHQSSTETFRGTQT
jgi:hypothetical protein